MLIRVRLLAVLTSGIVVGCVLPEHGGGDIFVGGHDGLGGNSATGGSNAVGGNNPNGGLGATGGAGINTQDTGGSTNISNIGGSPATGGSTGSFSETGGATGAGGSSRGCGSGVAGNTGTCAGVGVRIPCPSGWINNKDQTCATILVYGYCDTENAAQPLYCDDAEPTQHRCLVTLPEFSLHSTKLALTEDARILSLGATVGSLSTPFRVAIYSDVDGHPGAPVVQTSRPLTYSSPVENLNPVRTLSAGDYWLTILADHGAELSVYLVADEYSSYSWKIEQAGNLNGTWPWPQGPGLASVLVPYKSSRPMLFGNSLLHVFAQYVSLDTSPSN